MSRNAQEIDAATETVILLRELLAHHRARSAAAVMAAKARQAIETAAWLASLRSRAERLTADRRPPLDVLVPFAGDPSPPACHRAGACASVLG